MTGHDAYALFFLCRARMEKYMEHPSSPVMRIDEAPRNGLSRPLKIGIKRDVDGLHRENKAFLNAAIKWSKLSTSVLEGVSLVTKSSRFSAWRAVLPCELPRELPLTGGAQC
jgi:hypothetical protein